MNFYPNVGRLEDYPRNLEAILSKISIDSPSKAQMISWMEEKFGASSEFCRKLLEMVARVNLIVGIDRGKKYELSESAASFRQTGDPAVVLTALLGKVAGLDEVVQILAESDAVSRDKLTQSLRERFKLNLPRNQLEHRLNWLRGLGYADLVLGNLLLTEKGMKWWNGARIAGATPQERIKISHNDIENKLQVIGEFFEFQTTKRPSINQVLPSYALKLTEGDRQLDCLWVRYVHFGGQIKFPIEVHLSGNLADSLDRLETVSEYVQKAIIITTPDQEKTIVDRLRVKRSRLLDKLVIVNVEEVYKVMEATNVIKSLSEKIFSD